MTELHSAKTITENGRRALITGGSGFIGTHLARRLHAAGCEIVSLDLKPPREQLDGVRYVKGDVRDLEGIDLPPIDTIWNLAAIHTTPGHDDHEYYDTNVNGAIELVRFACENGISEIVFTSSISVYGPSENRKTEASAPTPNSAYGKSKWMAERIHSSWQSSDSSRKLIIIRPAVVFGHGEGGNFARMASLLKRGVFIFPGRRDTIKSCIYVEDLLDLAQSARDTGEDFVVLNGAYPECPTLEDIVTTLQRNYFPQSKLVDVPKGIVLTAAAVIGALNGLGGIHPDRVQKLLRSTNIFPQWAADRGLLSGAAFEEGIRKWSDATARTFI